MSFPNRYEGVCVDCTAKVPPSSASQVNGRTFNENNRWVTRCISCARRKAPVKPEPAAPSGGPAKAKARIWPDATKPGCVLIATANVFNEIAFANFKVACHRAGATHFVDRQTGRSTNRAPISALPHLVGYLRECAIEVELHPTLAAQIQTQANQARTAALSADERIRKITEDLSRRGEKLLPYQPEGIVRLAEHRPGGFGLFDDMGLGKTVQALLALDDAAPCIVLTRSSVVSEWMKAIQRWLPQRRVLSYDGRASLTFYPDPGQIAVGSYEVLPTEPTPGMPKGLVVIVDEAHNFKGSGNKRDAKWRLFRDSVLEAEGTIYPLTGTPMVNDDLDELWTVLQVAKLGEREFVSKRRFVKLAQTDPPEFARRLKNVMLRRLKVDVMKDLPPRIHTIVPCEITPEVRAQLDDALNQIVELAVQRAEDEARKDAVSLRALDEAALADVVANARANARANVTAAIDLAFDGTIRPPFELVARVKSILALAKLPKSIAKLDELEEQATKTDGLYDRPILFFSAHVQPVKMVGSRPGWACLTGETPQPERKRLIDDYQAGKLAGLALTIRAGGEGLNLTRGDKVVRNDKEWTPAANEQADARAWRYGQKHAVQVFDTVGDHALDERIQERLDQKEAAIASTVEQAVTRINEKRESLATRLETVLGTVALTPRKPKNVVEAWVYRGLLLLARRTTQAGLKIDGPTRLDLPTVERLADLARTVGLTEPQWEEGRRLLQRYRRQIGEQP